MPTFLKTALSAIAILLACTVSTSAAGIEDRLSVSLPKGDGPFPAVILMHMTNGPSSAERKWAKTLTRNGYAAITLESYKSISGSAAQLDKNVPQRIGHLKQTHARATKQPWYSGQVSVIGRSHGAWAVFDALKSGALGSKLHRAVASAPRCDGARSKTRRMTSRTPLLIVVGSRDRAHYSADCETLAAQITKGSVQIATFKAGHSVDVDSRAASKTILTFLK